jgi:hypothetical protein
MGSTQSIPITTLSTSTTSNIPIRVLSNANQLKGFDILISYDPDYVESVACVVDSAWVGGCNTNTPGSIQIAGVNSAFDTLGNLNGITVATISMKAKTSSSGIVESSIYGFVTEIRASNGILLSNAAFVAGNIPISVDTGAVPTGRRFIQTPKRSPKVLQVQPKSSRHLLAEGLVMGDVSNDQQFTLADLLFIQQYYNAATQLGCVTEGGDGCQSRSELNEWQLKQLAPVGESTTGARDIPYLIGVFLESLYFVTATNIDTAPEDTISVRVSLQDRYGVAAEDPNFTRVLFAFQSVQQSISWNDGVSAQYDTDKNIHYAYGVVKDGWFTLSADSGFEAETNVGVAFAMERGIGKTTFIFTTIHIASKTISNPNPSIQVQLLQKPGSLSTQLMCHPIQKTILLLGLTAQLIL